MEIAYVWIYRFKNITQKGFNLSPRVTFEFSPDPKELESLHAEGPQISGRLDLNIHPGPYSHQIFPKFISNITGVIGENGSGKSALIEYMIGLFSGAEDRWREPFLFCVIDEDSIKVCHSSMIVLRSFPDFLLKKNIIEANSFGEVFSNPNYPAFEERPLSELKCIYYNNSYEGVLKKNQIDQSANFADLSTSFLSHKYSREIIEDQIKITFERLIDNVSDQFKGNHIDFGFPDLEGVINYIYDSQNSIFGALANSLGIFQIKDIPPQVRFYNWARNENLILFRSPSHLVFRLDKKYDSTYVLEHSARRTEIRDDTKDILHELYELLNRDSGLDQLMCRIFFATLADYSIRYGSLNEWVGFYHEAIDEKDFSPEKLFHFPRAGEEGVNRIIEAYYELSEVLSSFEYRDGFWIPIEEEEKISRISNAIGILNLYYEKPLFFVWQYEGTNEIGGLSFGQTSLLSFFGRLIDELLFPPKNIILFLDEPDLGYHPEWQRKILYLLLKVLEKRLLPNSYIQVIITSHSPFLMSDLPKDHLILLQGEGGIGSQVAFQDQVHQTFGANIHTMLANAFFMKNGVIGEFAKDRINQVIEFLRSMDNRDQVDTQTMTFDEAEIIINMIGEPILKRKLMQMLESARNQR